MFTAEICTLNWRDAEAVQEKVREAGFEVEVLSDWIDEYSRRRLSARLARRQHRSR